MALLDLMFLVSGANASPAKAAEALSVLEQMYGYHDAEPVAAPAAEAHRLVEVDYDHGYAMVA